MIELGSIAGFSITSIIVVVLALFLFAKFVKKIIVNILFGGALYVLVDYLNIVHMPWSTLDGIIVALLGIPGTVILTIYRLIA